MDEKMRALAEEFCSKYYNHVRYYVYSRVFNKNEVEDLTADVFVKVTAKIDTYDPAKAAPYTWIYAIARNVVLDYFKKHRLPTVELDELKPSDDDVEEDVLKSERARELTEALKKLSDTERDIVLMRYFYGYNGAEIAKKLGLEHGHVRMTLMRSLKKLKKFLAD